MKCSADGDHPSAIVCFTMFYASFFADFSRTTYFMYIGSLELPNIVFPGTNVSIVLSGQLKLKEGETKYRVKGSVLADILFSSDLRQR